jgi:hypothetical protein
MNQYESPELIYIGTAAENILGILSVGSDSDGTAFPPFLEFAEDPECEE